MSKKHYSKESKHHHHHHHSSSSTSSTSSSSTCPVISTPDCPPPPPPCIPKVFARTLTECSNRPIFPETACGPVVAKLPVVISETQVQIDTEACIELPEDVLEIKRIRKNVFLTQCRLVPEFCDKHFGKVFLKGFIRKNIEYATVCNTGCGVVNGDIKHTTLDVDFECCTKVRFINRPIIKFREPADQIEYFEANILGECNPCKPRLLGTDLCQQDFFDHEKWTEKIFCELEDAKICEADIQRCPTLLDCGLPGQRTFREITEKVVVLLKFKLLQYQQVWIPPYNPPCPPHHFSDCSSNETSESFDSSFSTSESTNSSHSSHSSRASESESNSHSSHASHSEESDY